MAAYTSWPFRCICRRFGAALVTTEVCKARDLLRLNDETFRLISFRSDEHPIAAQIMSCDPVEAGEAAALLNERGFDMVDLNCGCPKRRVISDGLGGALMEYPEHIGRIIAGMVARSKVPVTVKIRAGRWKGRITAVEAALCAQDAGAVAVCVHPRYSEGASSLPPDWSVIAAVKAAARVPVIGNGGIHWPADVERMVSETGCDGVAIGQAAVGRPWIFRQSAELLETGVEPPRPTHEEILAILLEHYAGLIELHGERRGTMMMRKQSCHYAKALRRGKQFNMAVVHAATREEYMRAVQEYLVGAERAGDCKS